MGGGSALHVRELLSELAVTHPYHVDAANVAVLAVVVPRVAPPDDATIIGHDEFFGLEARARRRREELVPEGSDCRLPDEAAAVGWGRALEDAVVGHQAHDRVDVVGVEHLVESLDRREGLVATHACPPGVGAASASGTRASPAA